jgi:hypothetical protein
MTHLDKESPNFLIRLPLKENLLSIFKAQIHTFLNTTELLLKKPSIGIINKNSLILFILFKYFIII